MTDVLIAANQQDARYWLNHRGIPYRATGPTLRVITQPYQLRGMYLDTVWWTGQACLEHPKFMELHNLVQIGQMQWETTNSIRRAAAGLRKMADAFRALTQS